MEQDNATNIPVGALPGSARFHLLWDIDQILDRELTVHFLNPDLLETEKWKYGDSQLTTNNILDWIDPWNDHVDKYPKIVDRVVSKEKAQIRVLFTSNSKLTGKKEHTIFSVLTIIAETYNLIFLNACMKVPTLNSLQVHAWLL